MRMVVLLTLNSKVELLVRDRKYSSPIKNTLQKFPGQAKHIYIENLQQLRLSATAYKLVTHLIAHLHRVGCNILLILLKFPSVYVDMSFESYQLHSDRQFNQPKNF